MAGQQLANLSPMLLGEVVYPFTDPDWVFEIKFDGYRLLAASDATGVRLKSRNGADATKWFPEVAKTLQGLAQRNLVLDGEVCVLDEQGRSDFNRLHARAKRRRVDPVNPVVYCVFDVLVFGGRPVHTRPLLERKRHLRYLLGLPNLLVVDHIPQQGEALYKHVLRLELEGLVAKRLDAPYHPGLRSQDWLKIKRPGAVPAKRFDRSAAK